MLISIIILSILLPIISYILTFFLNRWIWIKIIRLSPINKGNLIGILFCFLSLIGTILLITMWIIEKDFDYNWFTPKEMRKK